MKKTVISILLSILLVLILPFKVFAIAGSGSFDFSLTIDGKDTKEVETGDIITVVLTLNRTDFEESYPMYAMQDEISYDSTFFELVEGSIVLNNGIRSTDISMLDEYREFYMNFLSISGGEEWKPSTMIGSFQLRVVGTSGVTHITSKDYLVALKDGSGSYACEAKDLTVIMSSGCIVRFVSNGGSEVEDVIANYGELLKCPENPKYDNYAFAGWYKDIGLQEEWDFDKDTVNENMTLYAKWTDKPVDTDAGTVWQIPLLIGTLLILVLLILFFFRKKVQFVHAADVGTKLAVQTVWYGRKLRVPVITNGPSMISGSWYQDAECTILWDFENDKVNKNMTLYGK
ncbi:MAG: hypothetical protein E7256_04060 [Lachnospiraceae bacterium]|nr:hypothetical protein [Lachnospiraceae bacterium]